MDIAVRRKYRQGDLLLKSATTAGFIFWEDLLLKTIHSKTIPCGFESCQGSILLRAITELGKLSENNSFGDQVPYVNC